MSDVQVGCVIGHWWGMSSSWFHRSNLREDSHGNPDGSGKCFISFYNISKPFAEPTGHLSFTYADFASKFYYYATDGASGYTIDEALDQAAYDCLGGYLENTALYTGYLVYANGIWWFSKLRVFGDCGMKLT